MKALVYTGKESMEYRDFADPIVQANEQIVRVEKVGICGSDMHAYHGYDPRRPAPLILGHEAAGVVVGGDLDGTRVTINPLVVDPNAKVVQAGRENIYDKRELLSMPPREGAFAEYVSVPTRNLVEVPDAVPFEKAALAEPLAVSWHSARLGLEALHPSMDRKALVLGGGAIGLAGALCLRAMGIEDITVVEPTESRRAYLESVCGEKAVASGQGSFPLIFDAVGYAATRKVASELVEPGGVIVHVGLGDGEGGLDIRRMTLQEISFVGTYCYTAQDFRDTAAAIFDGKLGPLDWVEHRSLSDGSDAFRDLHNHQVAAPKIILSP
ncbi:MAG: alcohol dehydrogenase catalytic domain-containing protein [Pseudomonadota bacterium]